MDPIWILAAEFAGLFGLCVAAMLLSDWILGQEEEIE